jgi:hypothetical protein
VYEVLVILLAVAIGATVRDLRLALPLAATAGLAVHVVSGEWSATPEFLLWDLGQAVVAAALASLLVRRVAAGRRAPL